MVVRQGDIWWADLGQPIGSAPGYRRPVVIVQSDAFNRSRLPTVLCVPITTNLKWANLPSNVPLGAASTGLPHDSVAHASALISIDQTQLITREGGVTEKQLQRIFEAIDILLGRRSSIAYAN